MTVLAPLLPGCLPPAPYALALEAEPGTPALALLGLPDWLGALAQGSTVLLQRAERRLTVARAASPGLAARLIALGPDHFRLEWSDASAAAHLARAIARTSGKIPPQAVELVWTGEGLEAWGAGGEPVRISVDSLALVGEVARDPLAAVPGQSGNVGRILVPDGVSPEWVLAFTTYAVRSALSATAQLPLPFLLREGEGTPEAVATLAAPELTRDSQGRLSLPASPAGTRLLTALAALPSYPERPLRQHRLNAELPAPDVLFDRSWTVPWEGERLLAALEARLAALGERPGRVEVFASEPPAVLADLGRACAAILDGLKLGGVALQVLPAYKQAYHFAMEVFLGRVFGRGVRKLEILVPREEEHPGMLGHVCSFVPCVAPADEVLADRLGLAASAVRVGFAPGAAFVFNAYGGDGALLCREEFTPLTGPFAMDPAYPGRSSRVETGGLRVFGAGGALLAEARVPTDAEVAQGAFLEGLADLSRHLAASPSLPLFGTLEVSAALSEPDEDLPVPWERYSPLEELHEEFYFGTLAAFEPLTQALGSGHWRAPGSIVPRVRAAAKAPTVVRLRATAPAFALSSAEPRDIAVSELAWEDGRVVCRAAAPEVGYLPLADNLPAGLALHCGDQLIEAPPPAAPVEPPSHYYPAEDARELTRSVALRSGALAWIEGFSFGGRPIPAAAWAAELGQGVASPRRLAQLRPTLLVVAGHHANETSSTVSALQLLSHLPEIGGRALVLIVPMENPDGAALHRELAAATPHWKLHAARFNALGHEYGHDGHDSPFGEALARVRLCEDFPVDVLVDDHGVPAHEWAQPFSGRSSPPLFPIAYTYPSGLIYGIGPGDDTGPDAAVEPLWRRATARLDSVPELLAAQRLLWDRYVRYGRVLCPERYPSERRFGWPFQATRRARTGRPQSGAAIEFITEVADEGSPAPLYAACVRAHLEVDIAFVEELGAWQGKCR